MPAYNHNLTRKDHLTIPRDTIPRIVDKADPSPVTPAVTGIMYPSTEDAPTEADSSHYRTPVARRFYTHPNLAESSIDDAPEPLENGQSMDHLWESLRQKKEVKMAKERPKVQSLEEAANDLSIEPASVEIPLRVHTESQMSAPRSIKKQKSISTFRESRDGRSIVTTFDIRGVEKQNIHVSFQRERLIIKWQTLLIEQWEENGAVEECYVVDKTHRTLPIPEGTKFEEIHCQMIGHSLVLRYPNMRCIRVEPRSRSGDS
ncbi:hypothetical protein BDZ94DRAFT_1184334 [Collybia nuda]|uniref:Uncharacterized protein n=1 Tax=Collybia nuda TaxID=64659 RepID=A0A9P5YG61_9AGAR|nr:hypothetical protein BDZ94DRAFT_1184334 [Collybia nuda]